MFTVTGRVDEGREASISWYAPEDRRALRGIGSDRGLDGDRDLVVRALIDEVERRTFPATPTGPFYVADLDDAEAALTQLGSYLLVRHTVDGDPPTIDTSVPDGAIPAVTARFHAQRWSPLSSQLPPPELGTAVGHAGSFVAWQGGVGNRRSAGAARSSAEHCG